MTKQRQGLATRTFGLARSDARATLARAKTIAEVKEVGDKAAAVAGYLRKQRDRWDEALDAEEVALEAHMRSAEILEEMKARGELGRRGGDRRSKLRPVTLKLGELLGTTSEEAGRLLAHRQARAAQLKAEDPDRVAAYIRQQRETYGAITLSGLVDAKAHVSQNTGQPEWYTPADYIVAARRVLGAIDLDPASSELAQETVRATAYYTAKYDGLAQDWKGRVWLNPPYTSGVVEKFTAKLCGHVADGSVPAAVLLVNNATDTGWFQGAAGFSAAICFPSGRIRFIDEQGNATGAPLQGQALLYFGEASESFVAEFKSFGFCVRRVDQ